MRKLLISNNHRVLNVNIEGLINIFLFFAHKNNIGKSLRCPGPARNANQSIYALRSAMPPFFKVAKRTLV